MEEEDDGFQVLWNEKQNAMAEREGQKNQQAKALLYSLIHSLYREPINPNRPIDETNNEGKEKGQERGMLEARRPLVVLIHHVAIISLQK